MSFHDESDVYCYDEDTRDYGEITCSACGTKTKVIVEDCFCFSDEGAGYTYEDEYGLCPHCEEALVCKNCKKDLHIDYLNSL